MGFTIKCDKCRREFTSSYNLPDVYECDNCGDEFCESCWDGETCTTCSGECCSACMGHNKCISCMEEDERELTQKRGVEGDSKE